MYFVGRVISPPSQTNNGNNFETRICSSQQHNKRQLGHRSSRSVSSLPSDLQNLSLQGPEDIMPQQRQASPPIQTQVPYNNISFPTTTTTTTTEKPPSWMLPNDRPPSIMNNLPISTSSLSPPLTFNHNNRRKSAFSDNRGHGRSVSEFTLPPLNSDNNNNIPPSLPPTRKYNPPSSMTTRTHRRAVSANTIDFMLSSSSHSSIRSQSYSPQEPSLTMSNRQIHSTNYTFFDQISSSIVPLDVKTNTRSHTNTNMIHHDIGINNNNNLNNIPNNNTSHHTKGNHSNVNNSTTVESSGRYICPYCQKRFSRPSSLRIHTYSHTGEKPFVCTEPGCGRHFSVQSNMRRHLRVHRLGRSANMNNTNSSNTTTLETTNEENELI
ncbi:uncharacterized protein BX663DRAFT_498330 [Cokeromyces recurvatus]|uniref:uncharacterized protein n=1 Tax=Cokeromyces recurvatus TaxID=90255 RepID=UPI0022201726|nr:uncharacterized protein BX663DRAFT_498330 [Cokeromyces recurvatus]KAI7905975.1 hypothetical protein BX663DRAFT_498330 [Cokeromyces recurvatus]